MSIVNSYLGPATYMNAAKAAGQSQRVSATYDEQQAADRAKQTAELNQKNRLATEKFQTDEQVRLAKAMTPIKAQEQQTVSDIQGKEALAVHQGELNQQVEAQRVERLRQEQQQKDIANITDTEIDGLSIPPEYKDVLKTTARLKVQTGLDATKVLVDQYDEKRKQQQMVDYQKQAKLEVGVAVADTDARAVVEGHQQSITAELAKRQVAQIWAQKQSETVRDELIATIASIQKDDRIPENLKAATIKAIVETKFKDLDLKFQVASATQSLTDQLFAESMDKSRGVTPQNPTEAAPTPSIPQQLMGGVNSAATYYGMSPTGIVSPGVTGSFPKPGPRAGAVAGAEPRNAGPQTVGTMAAKPGSKGPVTRVLAQQFFDETDPKLSHADRVKAAQLRAVQEGYTL
jgi:hypothetical protein